MTASALHLNSYSVFPYDAIMVLPIAPGQHWHDKLRMKLKLLLCGAALLVAGCASEESPFTSAGEYAFTFDMVPSPVPGLSPTEMAKIAEVPTTTTTAAPFDMVNRISAGAR
jgi:hypothetical protein